MSKEEDKMLGLYPKEQRGSPPHPEYKEFRDSFKARTGTTEGAYKAWIEEKRVAGLPPMFKEYGMSGTRFTPERVALGGVEGGSMPKEVLC